MSSRVCVTKTVEISTERYNQLVTNEATLSNIRRIIADGRYLMKPEDLITSLKCILSDPAPEEKKNE